MVRQMVGDEVSLAFCGGDPDGGLGSDVNKILSAIKAAWTDKGVAVLVDLGGAETNTEMAIELLQADMQPKVLICNAPIVEGAIMAATEASSGSSLQEVRATAEELCSG
jgi:dihydroxyacetone kinase phosphotransfer subunit